jgi:hypothetical protein
MAKAKAAKKALDSYTIKGTHKVVKGMYVDHHTFQSGDHHFCCSSLLFCLRPKPVVVVVGRVNDVLLRSKVVKGEIGGGAVGDTVLMRSQEADKPPYVAKIEKIEADSRSNVKVRVRWYYRPEESLGGRRQFHGVKELFLSDHYDIQSADTIEGKCIVHTFKNYTKLDSVGSDDYFCRFEYKAATGGFTPDRVAV